MFSPVAQSEGSANSSTGDWIAWQLADSALPAGGFAHSGGLEACYRLGHVQNAAELENHLTAQLYQWARGTGPIMLMAFRDAAQFSDADALCELLLNHPVANRASRVQGRGFLFAVTHAFGTENFPGLKADLQQAAAPGHLAPVFGAVCRILGLEEISTIRLFLFVQLRGVVAAAVRLGIIGPMVAGALQHRLLCQAEPAVKIARMTAPHDVAQTAPIAELFAANHDRLYSRLFQS